MAKPQSPRDVVAWHGLFSLTQRPADDQALLATELARWCAARGGVAAAIYAAGADGHRRLAQIGDASFPDRFGARPPRRWTAVELPESLLLLAAADATPAIDPATDPELLLLAAAARVVQLKQLIQEQHFQARFRGVELEALYDMGLSITSNLEYESLGDEVLMRAAALLERWRSASRARCSTPEPPR